MSNCKFVLKFTIYKIQEGKLHAVLDCRTSTNGCAQMTREGANPSPESAMMHTEMGGLFRRLPMIRIVSRLPATRKPGACAVFNPSPRQLGADKQRYRQTLHG